MKANHVWVIEMLVNGKWESCSDCSITRYDSIRIINNWCNNNPDDKFRVRKYVAAPERNRKHERLMKAIMEVK